MTGPTRILAMSTIRVPAHAHAPCLDGAWAGRTRLMSPAPATSKRPEKCHSVFSSVARHRARHVGLFLQKEIVVAAALLHKHLER